MEKEDEEAEEEEGFSSWASQAHQPWAPAHFISELPRLVRSTSARLIVRLFVCVRLLIHVDFILKNNYYYLVRFLLLLFISAGGGTIVHQVRPRNWKIPLKKKIFFLLRNFLNVVHQRWWGDEISIPLRD